MRLVLLLLVPLALLLLTFAMNTRRAASAQTPAVPTPPGKYQQATFAAGCFWGVEEAFRHLPGVIATQVGYTGGTTVNPTYHDVCTDLTGHAEAVSVTFDPDQISYPELLDAFWSAHDPTTLNRQGPDVGTQYRSAVFFHNLEQETLARTSLAQVEAAHFFKNKIVTQILPATAFYPAETYHQRYLAKNGGTCHLGPATVRTPLAQQSAQSRQTAHSQ